MILGRALLLFVLVQLASTAVAQEVDSARDEEARALFTAGVAAYDRGDYATALRHFRAAYEASHRPGLLYNVGQAADRMRDDRAALEAFEEYLRLEPNSENAEAVRARLPALRASVERGESAPPPDETGPAQSGGGPDVVGPAVLLGVAGAALAFYAIMGGLVLVENDRLASTCGSGATRTCTDAQLSDLHTFAALSDVGWITAAAAGVAGLAWLIVALTSSSAPPAEAVSVLPFATSDGAGIVLRGSLGS